MLCLRQLCHDLPRPWLEVGVGTGRFAHALAIDVGIDPASRALQYAKQRGVRTLQATGQSLPFNAGEFGGTFLIATLCFADDPGELVREAARVTRRQGGVVFGLVPADSPWEKFYTAMGKAGHLFYSKARFFTLEETEGLAGSSGLQLDRAVSTLFSSPDEQTIQVEPPRQGKDHSAGFVTMLFRPAVPDSR
ncbi:MAG: class I SAM-dependent methyltransferase [Pirellulales bacterium]|nr:class I SAM-dependent methyltransferase [Pirellulales bacterium]